jgi:hypothetical protein
MVNLAFALLALAVVAAEPVPDAVQRAVEARLARLAVEMAPGSLERAEGPACPPYRLFLFQSVRAAQKRGVAVADDGDIAISDDAGSLARFFAVTKFFERHGPQDALEVWRLLAQAGPVLDAAAVEKLPKEERAAAFAPRREDVEGGVRVVGFIQQGEEIFRVQLDLAHGKADVSLKSLGEAMGKDEIDEAIRALRSSDEIVRAAAAFELGEKKDARAFQALCAALEDRSANVRGTCAQALVRQVALDAAHRKDAAAALGKAQAREQDASARESLKAALQALGPKGK